jgi:hypothetical protein
MLWALFGILVSLGGKGSVDGQAPSPAAPGVAADAAGAAGPPEVDALSARLRALQGAPGSEAVGPALEHASIAIARAQHALSPEGRRESGAVERGLRARAIAHAALTLAAEQLARQEALAQRDAAARQRLLAEGAERIAQRALERARENVQLTTSASSTEAATDDGEAPRGEHEAHEPDQPEVTSP